MNKEILKKTIDDLAKLINLNVEEKDLAFKKYSQMHDKEVIKELAISAYQKFSDNSDMLDYSLSIIRNINAEICPTIEIMKDTLNKMFSNDIEGNMSIEKNHNLINEELIKFTKLFNENGIDYYIVGALPCFIKTGTPLFRYHDDIDIMVNEEDISKISKLIEESEYKFSDDRFPIYDRFKEMEEKKPPHTVMAQNPNNEFHLGFFTFVRNPDNSIVVNEYEHRLEGEEVITDRIEKYYDLECTKLYYDEKPSKYEDTYFKSSTVESVYYLKDCTKRPKDIKDMSVLEPHLDNEKLNKIQNHKIATSKCEKVSNDEMSSKQL